MKRFLPKIIFQILFLLFVFQISSSANGLEEIMKIDKPASVWPSEKLDETGTKTKSPVTFNHGYHGKSRGCHVCHHVETDLKEGDTKAESCFTNDCHGPKVSKTVDGKLIPTSWQIIHDKELKGKDPRHALSSCEACHAEHNKVLAQFYYDPESPVGCKDCHDE